MRLLITLICLGWFASSNTASAQWIYNPEDAVMNAASACTGGVSRQLTYNVTTPGIVDDVDLGLRAIHTWRGDIRARLTSPGGTTVQLITPDTGQTGNFDNYRIRLDDGAPVLINTGAHATNQAATGDRYEVRVRPSNALAAFNGETANGQWTLELCDDFPTADNGTVTDTTLFITPRTPPAAPPFTCAVGQPLAYDWSLAGAKSWAAGSLVNGYDVQGIPLAFAVTGATNRLVPRNGQDTPVTSSDLSPPGLGPDILSQANFASRTEEIAWTLNLGQAGLGVGGVAFNLRDVDRNAWQDRVSVTGSLDGTSVAPVLTPSLANRVAGNAVIGTALNTGADPAGRATVTFQSPVDRVTLVYGSGPDASADPPTQLMAFFADMQICPLPMPALTAVKSVEAAQVDAFLTPGAEVLYKITVSHGPASNTDATEIDIDDVLPDTLEFVSAATTGFSVGAFANPPLPSANTDCTGGACVVSFEGGTLPNNVVGVIQVTARIK